MRKWIVTIAQPTVVHDVLRHPVEGSLTVSEAEAQRLHDNDLLVGDPEPLPKPDEDVDEHSDETAEVPADLAGKTAAQLKPIALREGAPLNDANTPEAIIAAIVAHRATKEA